MTPFAERRDSSIMEFSKQNGIDFINTWDYFLADFSKVLTLEGNYYKVFTPFMKKAIQFTVDPL